MKSRRNKLHLDASIRYSREHHKFVVLIDGDEFYSDSYEHAVCLLIQILARDEIRYK